LFLYNLKLTGLIPSEIGQLDDLVNLSVENNKLSGAIPGSLTLLTKTTLFRLTLNSKLCRLDAASTTVTTARCTTACPYPTCACNELSGNCRTGNAKTISTAVNPATPFYPADDTTCCPVGASLLEKLVTENHLDCTAGRPCVVTMGIGMKGVSAVAVTLNSLNLSGSIPPEISELTALTLLNVVNNKLTGSIPPEISNLPVLTRLCVACESVVFHRRVDMFYYRASFS
jgi:Leucine-rich repeat (LRR) protein